MRQYLYIKLDFSRLVENILNQSHIVLKLLVKIQKEVREEQTLLNSLRKCSSTAVNIYKILLIKPFLYQLLPNYAAS